MLWTFSLGMVDLNAYLRSPHNGLTEAWVAHLSSPIAAGSVPDGGEVPGMPLTVGKASTPGDLDLSWGRSCQSSDSDYAVYECLVGDFTSHAPRFCATGGATSATLTPASDSRYYLVVPLSPNGAEGSYGTVSDGTERRPSATSCQPQVLTSCM